MKPRVVVAGLSIVVVALIVAMLWNADDRGDVEATHGVVDERVAAVAGDAPAVAVISHRDTVDASVAAPAAAPVQLAFIGRVEDFTGNPLEGVRVQRVVFEDEHDVLADETRTRADGSFALPVTRATPSTLQFTAVDHVDAKHSAVVPGEFLLVRMDKGVALHGRVVDRRTREPIAAADVSREVVGRAKCSIVRSDDRGAFAIVVRALPALVTATKTGFGIGRVVVASADEPVELELPSKGSPATLWYRVVDKDTNEPVENVTIEPGPSERLERGVYRAGTYFGFDQDRYTTFDAPGYPRQHRKLDAQTGADLAHAIEVALTPASSMVGRIVDRERGPVGGATIKVRRDFDLDRYMDGSSAFVEESASTDADGRFSIADVPFATSLKLFADVDGIVIAVRGALTVPTRALFDCGEIVVDDAFTLEVTVTRAADATPIAGACVRTVAGVRDDVEHVRVATTDARGVASFARSNRVRFVAASALGCAPAWMAVDAGDHASRVAIALETSERLAGTVRGSDGLPLSDATVEVSLVAKDDVREALVDALSDSSLDPGRRTVTTDGAGRFAFENLASGEYTVFARHPDADPYAAGAARAGAITARTGRDDVTLTIPLCGAVVLRVTSAQTGAPCDHVEYSVTANGSGGRSSMHGTNGYATFDVVAGVAFNLDVAAAAHAPQRFVSLTVAARELRVMDVQLDAECQWSGVARFDDGSPAPFASVTLVPSGAPGTFEFPNTRADASGAFRFTRLAPGLHDIRVSASPSRLDDSNVPMSVEPSTLTLGAGEARSQDLRLTYADGGPLEITLNAENVPDDSELVGLVVSLYPKEGDRSADCTGAKDGEVWRIPGLPVGTYTCSGRLMLKSKANGEERRPIATCEPATIEVTRGAMAITLTMRGK